MLELRKALVKEEITHSSMFDIIFTVEDSVFDVLTDWRMKEILDVYGNI